MRCEVGVGGGAFYTDRKEGLGFRERATAVGQREEIVDSPCGLDARLSVSPGAGLGARSARSLVENGYDVSFRYTTWPLRHYRESIVLAGRL
ncbi:hypothetical protein J6590_019146 [Homalodisca vitripennis]|nr:hypothetical protein J6590_019146 [Homalodisca vitripennis]